MNKVLYPGSFDPITKGHMNIIDQAVKLFDEVIVCVSVNSKKQSMLTQTEKVELIKKIYSSENKVKVISSSEASVDVALNNDCAAMIRGLRSLTDFDFEIQLANINKDISNKKVNTVCLFADTEFQHISSSMVKELFNLNKDISKYVPKEVETEMKKFKK